jgi:hypothetical protein
LLPFETPKEKINCKSEVQLIFLRIHTTDREREREREREMRGREKEEENELQFENTQ